MLWANSFWRAQVDGSDYYIMVAPQNVVGNTIVTSLGEHVRAPPYLPLHLACHAHALLSCQLGRHKIRAAVALTGGLTERSNSNAHQSYGKQWPGADRWCRDWRPH